MNTVGSHYKRPPSIWSIDFRFPANCATLNMDPLETQLPFRGSWSLASSSSKCLPFFCSIRDVLTNTWQFWTLPVWEGEEDVCVERVSLHTRDLLRDQQIHGSMCTAMIHEFHKNISAAIRGEQGHLWYSTFTARDWKGEIRISEIVSHRRKFWLWDCIAWPTGIRLQPPLHQCLLCKNQPWSRQCKTW